MIRVAMIVFVVGLGACGVDGPPERPATAEFNQQAKIRISGDARVGVSTEF
jgi:hypothetical protein